MMMLPTYYPVYAALYHGRERAWISNTTDIVKGWRVLKREEKGIKRRLMPLEMEEYPESQVKQSQQPQQQQS